ncbi:MAG: ferredoxin, partial [Acidobacteriota bacterium]|nr:ferredoxin [Acidobacteriota bacterium]
RFRKQFRTVPRDAWNENLIPLHDFLDLAAEDREGRFPYIWAVNQKNRLIRVIPAAPLVASCEDRRNFWRMLKAFAGVREQVEVPDAGQVRAEFAKSIAARIMELAGSGELPAVVLPSAPTPTPANGNGNLHAGGDYTAPWIDSAQCTSCDECTTINPKIFAYDEHKHAYIKNAKGGAYKDLVRAAEKCTAQVIHPGTPWDPNEKDLAKLVQRAAKYN